MADAASRTPVVVGVGQFNDRPDDPALGLNPLELMEQAARAADADAGGGWLGHLDSLGVVAQLSFPELNPLDARLAERIGAQPKRLEQTRYPSGVDPLALLAQAANAIAAGEAESALVVGGEALRTAAQRAAARGEATKNATRAAAEQAVSGAKRRYGLVAPLDVYPLYENATRAAWGQTLAQAQDESAQIWSLFSEVAARNPDAWIRTPRRPEEILAVSDNNRRVVFPYTKLMVANSSVNQAAGFIVASLAAARRRGVPEHRLVYVGRGAAAKETRDVLARETYGASSSMQTVLEAALESSDLTLDDLDYAELYSCFPCIPKMARRVIGWPIERPATVFGGLTFGGGPIANYMSHAVAAMVGALRSGGRHGLLFANGGLANHNHALIVSRDPDRGLRAPADSDFQAQADARRAPAPALVENYGGPARIETYTVLYRRDGSPEAGVIVARTPAGERFLARVDGEDADAIAFLTDGRSEPVGSPGEATAAADAVRWRPAI